MLQLSSDGILFQRYSAVVHNHQPRSNTCGYRNFHSLSLSVQQQAQLSLVHPNGLPSVIYSVFSPSVFSPVSTELLTVAGKVVGVAKCHGEEIYYYQTLKTVACMLATTSYVCVVCVYWHHSTKLMVPLKPTLLCSRSNIVVFVNLSISLLLFSVFLRCITFG